MDARGSGDRQSVAPLLESRQSRESDFTPEDLELHDPQHGHSEVLTTNIPHHDPTSATSKFLSYTTLLFPSFLTWKITGEPSPWGTWYPTAFLDGLRGVACITVFNDHIMTLINTWGGVGWGLNDNANRLWQLPVVRLVYNGHFAVLIFFVISGFALSVSTVKLMGTRTRDSAAFTHLITSSVFRRPLRLFLPVWISTLPVFLLLWLQVYAAADTMRETDFIAGFPRPHPLNETLGLQTLDLIYQDARMVNIFQPAIHTELRNKYNYPAWTIPLEFRASLILYLTHAATFNLQRQLRISLVLCATIYAVIFDQFELPLFWAGYMLAEWFFASPLSSPFQKGSQPNLVTRMQIPLAFLTLSIGLWTGSYPLYRGSDTPGYKWLGALTPPCQNEPVDWWDTVGAICIVGAISRCPSSSSQPILPPSPSSLEKLSFRLKCIPQDFFSSPACRYLGKISFALYLTHATVVDTVAIPVFYFFFGLTGTDHPYLCGLGFILAYLPTLACVIWVADIFWRLVDRPCVQFARLLEKKWSNL